MGDDKLTHAERIRLESFAQAISSSMSVRLVPPLPAGVARISDDRPPTMADVFKRAEEIETWLKKAVA